ncbi:glutathione synthase/RimK-type ligase-like ATP-grasp enzyme [Oikeobacillus pervagus]|uniref:Glutathione synthase/RimK-type ligase-like ATP-grasp enzyme n=1 Tax=Oikeobacillus pervagus TaxID=1325931 RepID=A0AAJ1WIZ9_9BACI|nr:hypothetical protein [Oikeobacillus pervagus]MDQ0214938.1 glutathione synthase/RimK-type ligase-like ATP-grasp enzyme [Oikeobacillus pervagus]
MRVLIITNKDDVTVDFVVKELQKRNLAYYRLNTEDIPNKVNISFDFDNNRFEILDKVKKQRYSLLNFNSVYYRRPQLNNFDFIEKLSNYEINYLKSELNFILEGIYKLLEDKYWLNNVYRIREAENKIYQLQLAKEVGFCIPNSLISNQYNILVNFYEKNDNNCIIKPIKSGYMLNDKGSKAIFTTKVEENIFNNPVRVESFPLYLQRNIPKKFDIRVTVIGERVFAAEIHSQINEDSSIDWRRGLKPLEHYEHILPIEIKRKCIELTHKLKLNYSAIDLIYTGEDEYIFLEINPNGQWAWIEKRLHFPLSREIVNLLEDGV